MRCIALLSFVLLALPVAAQQRVVVVPAEGGVAVPARGAAAPTMVPSGRPRLTREGRTGGGRSSRHARGADATVQDLAVPALLGLPLMAAAGAAAAVVLGGQGTVPGAAPAATAPARTR